MTKLDMYKDRVWVKLTTRGLVHLTERCAQIADFVKDTAMAGQQMARFARQDGWFEFSLCDLMSTFGELAGDKRKEVPFEGNEVFLERPY